MSEREITSFADLAAVVQMDLDVGTTNRVWSRVIDAIGTSGDLRERFFGSADVELDGSGFIVARRDTVAIAAIPSWIDGPGSHEVGRTAVSAFLVRTDGQEYEIYHWDKDSWGKPLRRFSATDLDAEVHFCGSLWDSLHPTHHALLTRSRGFVLPPELRTSLFAEREKGSLEKGTLRRLERLAPRGMRLASLRSLVPELADTSDPPLELLSRESGYRMLRVYDPRRSPLLDFGSACGAPQRDDFVTSYIDDGHEYHREFLIDDGSSEDIDILLRRASFDFLHMLAVRRTKLFRLEFAARVFTIMLPPVLLEPVDGSGRGIALFPCVTLYRARSRSYFRRTVSLTTIIVPVACDGSMGADSWVSRRSHLAELRTLAKELKTTPALDRGAHSEYRILGPLGRFVGGRADTTTLPTFAEAVATTLLTVLMEAETSREPSTKERKDIVESAFASSMESQLACLMLHVNWKPSQPYTQPWEGWLASGDDPVLQRSLFRTLYYEDFLGPHVGYASEHALHFSQLNIGNVLGADMTGMTIYDPRQELKFIIFPETLEEYPNYSIVRWMAWSVFVDAALAVLPSMIARFYAGLGARGELQKIIGKLDNMIEDFVEFYDLDIREYVYRREYESLRSLMRVDADYQILLDKFESVKEDASLREQRLINKLLVAFTVATLMSATIAAIATLDQWSVGSLMSVMAAATLVASVAAYLLFDPVRRIFDRGRR